MGVKLEPSNERLKDCQQVRAGGAGYALLTEPRLLRLVRAMPDCQSAVLLCLTWQSLRNEKMKYGKLAGSRTASISGPQLTEMTKRPLRTVRHALRQLRSGGLIKPRESLPGRKRAYRLPFLDGDHPVPEGGDAPEEDGRTGVMRKNSNASNP